ncbi:MAG: hypothetical protein LBN07_00930 [Christensenellaceae bacterium]|jgi:hypothetical protein|nr:hypothetical protein [Christensenellaceae bacterium]
MKKFLIFLAVCVALAAVGFSIYYFTKDNEVIRLNYTTIPVNKGATIEAKGLLEIENPSRYTTISYGSNDSGILEYNSANGLFLAKAGGKTNIVIETRNNRYKRMTIEVVVRDGTEEFPYIISNEADLLRVGNSADFTLDKHYKVDTNNTAKEIVLTAKWIPIGIDKETGTETEFTGVFDGNGHKISYVNVSAYTHDEIIAVCKKVDTGTAGPTDVIEYSDGTFDYVSTNASNAMREYNNLLATKIKNAGFMYALGETAVVHDLILDRVTLFGDFDKAGGVASQSAGKIISVEVRGGKLDGSIATGGFIDSIRTTAYIGGIVGRNVGSSQGSMAIIDRCAAIIAIGHIADQVVGGVTGRNEMGLVTESYFRGVLSQDTVTKTFGGIIGENYGYTNALGTKVYYANARDSFALIYIVSTSSTFGSHDTSKIAGAIGKNVADTTKSNNIFGLHFALVYVTDGGDPLNSILVGGFKIGLDTIKEATGAQPDVDAGNGGFNNASEMSNQTKYISRSTRNGWNFVEVWQLDSGNSNLTFPVLRKGAIGSNFDKDPNEGGGEIEPPEPPAFNYQISDAQDLYNKLSAPAGTLHDGQGPDEVYTIIADLNLSTINSNNGWTVIAQTFTGGLYGAVPVLGGTTRAAVLTGLNIKKTVPDVGVGMFRESNGGVFSNLVIDGVTITGVSDSSYISRVGVLAGKASGTDVISVEIKNVILSIEGYAFGTMFGETTGGEIKNSKVSNIDGSIGNQIYNYAGGIVGLNGDKNAEKQGAVINNVIIESVKLVAYRLGGVAGYNYRQTISNADVSGLVLLQYKDGAIIAGDPNRFIGIISENQGLDFYNVFVGGIVGQNYGMDAKILNSYASSNIQVSTFTSTINREVYIIIGGIAGKNEKGTIQDVYVYSTLIETHGNSDARIGGIVGEHDGIVHNALVNNDVNIKSSTTYDKTGHRSLAGGIAGITWGDTLKTGLIRNSAVYAANITGFYAGGLAGMSYGNIETSYVGSTSNITTIKGFYAGGVAGAILGNYQIDSSGVVTKRYGGQVSTVYAHVELIAELSKTDAAGQATVGINDGSMFQNGIVWENIKNLNKGIAAGISPFIMGEAKVSQGYTVASFNSGDNAGYRFQTTFSQCAGDLTLRRYWTAGTMDRVIYVNEQSVTFQTPPQSTEPGIKKTAAQLKTDFGTFGWTASHWAAGAAGEYPVINGLNNILKNIVKVGTNPILV